MLFGKNTEILLLERAAQILLDVVLLARGRSFVQCFFCFFTQSSELLFFCLRFFLFSVFQPSVHSTSAASRKLRAPSKLPLNSRRLRVFDDFLTQTVLERLEPFSPGCERNKTQAWRLLKQGAGP